MIICFDFNYWKEIKSADLLTYSALVLAFLAYCRSVNRDLESWKSLLISLRSDLKIQENWLGNNGYFQETYNDKKSFSPLKIIYPLSFESLPEIIRRGAKELPGVSDKFINWLSLFNERVMAFNSALDHIKNLVSNNPVMSEKLNEKLVELGVNKNEEELKFSDFKEKIRRLRKEDDIFHLATNIRRLNRMVHVEIIGNKNKEDKLNYLYHKIIKNLDGILNDFDERRPFFIKYQKSIIVMTLLVFFLIEIFFK